MPLVEVNVPAVKDVPWYKGPIIGMQTSGLGMLFLALGSFDLGLMPRCSQFLLDNPK